ncbi:hypothetical protein ACC722_38890, partial [Rhizobium ruizarguesonis]
LETDDPLWRLPLYSGYEKDIRTKFADLTNAPAGGMAGAITAALFLKRFVGFQARFGQVMRQIGVIGEEGREIRTERNAGGAGQ